MLRPNLDCILRESTYVQKEEQLRDPKEMGPPGRREGPEEVGWGSSGQGTKGRSKRTAGGLRSLQKLVGSHQWGLTRDMTTLICFQETP